MTSIQVAVVLVVLLIAAYLFSKTEHLSDGKGSIVLFSQDWCSACKEFKPTWDKFKNMKEITDLVNVVELDPQPFNVGSYPTIRFYKKDPHQYPDEFVLYDSQRTLGDLMKFVRDNI